MNNEVYHVFQVHDYKGGELSTSINLSRGGVVNELSNSFWGIEEDVDLETATENEVVEVIEQYYQDDDRFSIYAGNGSTVMEIFKSTDKGLRGVSIESFFKDLARQMMSNAKDNVNV